MQTLPSAKQEMIITEESALSHNIPRFVSGVANTVDTGNILLTGTTGFLGIHVLKHLLDFTDKTVFCLLRATSKAPDSRLKNMLMYYFDDPMEELFGNRICVIKGDITDRASILALEEYDFKTVINCAACVKHFVQDDTLDRINWHGVENLIEFCLKSDRRLVHVSTVSVVAQARSTSSARTERFTKTSFISDKISRTNTPTQNSRRSRFCSRLLRTRGWTERSSA